MIKEGIIKLNKKMTLQYTKNKSEIKKLFPTERKIQQQHTLKIKIKNRQTNQQTSKQANKQIVNSKNRYKQASKRNKYTKENANKVMTLKHGWQFINENAEKTKRKAIPKSTYIIIFFSSLYLKERQPVLTSSYNAGFSIVF